MLTCGGSISKCYVSYASIIAENKASGIVGETYLHTSYALTMVVHLLTTNKPQSHQVFDLSNLKRLKARVQQHMS